MPYQNERAMPRSMVEWRNYEPSIEDRAAIAEFFAEERAVAERRKVARKIAETDTRSERAPSWMAQTIIEQWPSTQETTRA